MSTETTSSMVVPVTTSSLVTTAAPVTTTVNNPPVAENPPAADENENENENKIDYRQFSYDDKSKILTIIMIIIPILAIFLEFFLKVKFNINYRIIIVTGIIGLLLQIIMIVLLALHYKKLSDSAKETNRRNSSIYDTAKDDVILLGTVLTIGISCVYAFLGALMYDKF